MLGSFRPAGLATIILAVAFAVTFLPQDKAEASDYFLRFPWRSGKEAYITQGYATDPAGSSHAGADYYALDFDVEWGGTLGDISAAAYGKVVGKVTGTYCNPDLGYGNYVDIKSTTPSGATRYARYAHLSSVSVSSGQTLFQGQKVGVEGNTGKTYDCAYHLHFRWTSEQNCASEDCAKPPEPMSGEPADPVTQDFVAGETKTSDNAVRPEFWGVRKWDTGSGQTEVHIQEFAGGVWSHIRHDPTSLDQTGSSWQFDVGYWN